MARVRRLAEEARSVSTFHTEEALSSLKEGGASLCLRRLDGYSAITLFTMGSVKSLWASVQEDPSFMRRVNGWLAVFWIAMIPVSYFTHWLNSVTYVSALSLWALVSGHWSAWQAARVEVAQQEQFDQTSS